MKQPGAEAYAKLSVERFDLEGVSLERLSFADARVTCIPDPAPTRWDCYSLLPSISPKMLASAEEKLPAGTANAAGTITISFSTFLIELPGLNILVDTGIGNDKDRPGRPSWHRRSGSYLRILETLAVKPDDVDIVVNTHLHADHVGWNTTMQGDRWIPTFMNARYIAASAELDYWLEQYAEDPSVGFNSFRDSVAPIVDAGRFERALPNAEVAPGLTLVPVPGHTHGMMAVELQRNGRSVRILADVIHHPIQLIYPEVCTRACLDLAAARETRRRVLDHCAEEGTIVATTHFPAPFFGRIARRGDSHTFDPLPVVAR